MTAPGASLTSRGAAVTVAAQAVGRGITLLVVLGSTALVTRTVGIETYADWVTALSLMAMAGFLLDPGITPVIVRRLVQDPDATPRPGTVLLARLALGLAAAAFVAGLTAVLRGPDSLLLGAILGAQLLPRAAVMNAGAWLQADQRLHRQTVLEAIMAALGLAGLAVAASLDAAPAALAAIGFLAPALLLAALMQRELRLTPSSRLPPADAPQRPRIRSVLVEVAPLAASLVFVTLYTRVDIVFVNAAADAADVAAYLFAFQFVEQLIVLGAIIGAAVLPLMAARATRAELFTDPLTHDLLSGLAAAGALGSLGLIAIAEPLTRVIGGPELVTAAEPLVLLAPTAAVLLVAIPLGTMYLALGLGRRYLYFNLLALAFNVAGNAALTLPFGIDAAARLTWATELAVAAAASAPLWRGGSTARGAALRITALVALTVAASEAVAAGVPAALGAVAAAVVVLSLGGRSLWWMLRELRRSDPPGAGAPDVA